MVKPPESTLSFNGEGGENGVGEYKWADLARVGVNGVDLRRRT